MKNFQEMLRKITSSPHHKQMMRFVAPLHQHFGINHFWYYKITTSGNYCYLGTHSAWSEFCFDASMLSRFPCLRHPNTLKPGIHLMKASPDSGYQHVLKTAWENFKINFSINLLEKTPEGVELSALPPISTIAKPKKGCLMNCLCCAFTKVFRTKHKKIFQLLDDNQVNLTSEFGNVFYEQPQGIAFFGSRKQFLQDIGLERMLKITPREYDILRLLAHGYPASFIAHELQLSVRTVKNYIDNIKGKLSCFLNRTYQKGLRYRRNYERGDGSNPLNINLQLKYNSINFLN